MEIVALLTLLLSMTGVVLWPGWRKLAAGFQIKWRKAHIKRINFDIHKVAGIITAVFLALIGFTGFAWNVLQAKVTEAFHVVAFTPKPTDPVSQAILNQFGAVHFGTFWSISSRILYVVVGIAPTVLMVTGVVMWAYRRQVKKGVQSGIKVTAEAKH